MNVGKKQPYGLQFQIMDYLGKNPKKMIKEIQEGVGNTYHSAISRAMKNLKDEEVVIELDTFKPERGPPVSLWGLTERGLMEIIEHWAIPLNKVIEYSVPYRDLYDSADGMCLMKEKMELLKINNYEEIFNGWLKTSFLLIKNDYANKTRSIMIMGYLRSMLSSEDFVKLMDYDGINLETSI